MRHMIAVRTCWLKLLLPAVLLALGSSLLSGCGSESSTSSTPTLAPSSTVSAPPATVLSVEDMWEASVAAVETLGPVRISIKQETEYAGGSSSASSSVVEVTQLLDQENALGLQTLRRADGTVEQESVDGRDRVSYRSDPVSYGKRVSLTPPRGLPLPLWIGEGGQSYEHLLTGAEHLVAEDESGGGWRLSWARSGEEASVEMTLVLAADYLPVRLVADIVAPNAGGETNPERVVDTISYTFEALPELSPDDVVIAFPKDAILAGTTIELDLDRPLSSQADWGQYWLGPEVLGHTLVLAEHSDFHPDPSYEPQQESITLIYDRPTNSPNVNIQVYVFAPDSPSAQSGRESCEGYLLESGQFTKTVRMVAGQEATVYTRQTGNGKSIVSFSVFLPDAYVELSTGGMPPEEAGQLLDAVQRLR